MRILWKKEGKNSSREEGLYGKSRWKKANLEEAQRDEGIRGRRKANGGEKGQFTKSKGEGKILSAKKEAGQICGQKQEREGEINYIWGRNKMERGEWVGRGQWEE